MTQALLKKWTCCVTMPLAASATPAMAQDAAQDVAPAVVITGSVMADVFAVVDGPALKKTSVLSNLDLIVDGDLDQLIGWRGARVKLHGLGNYGGRPNDFASTLQGVNNIEVSQGRSKLYQVYVEQDLFEGRASVLVGLADLNADFYQNDSAGLLIAPGFGIGTELSSTGPNGPSIFPSTAPTLRVRLSPQPDLYLKAAVVGADAGVLGDPGGVHLSMREGALLIGEAGWTGRGKLAVGFWRYTKLQDDIRETNPDGTPVGQRAQGAYVLIEQPLTSPTAAGPAVSVFGRFGATDGATTPFPGGWQIGALVEKILPGRPDSQLSFGVSRALVSRRYRDNAADAGQILSGAETGLEITFSDQLAPWLRIQPDLQYVIHPAGDPNARPAVVFGLRVALSATKEFGQAGN